MQKVVGVRFKQAGKIYFFEEPSDLELGVGDRVIVQTARGMELGRVAVGPRDIPEAELAQPVRPVVRKASADDERRAEENRDRARQAFRVCADKIREHDLPMRLVDAEYTLDRSRLTFYFTAEERVDFRRLVRDLAGTLHARIELRQIGARDEAKILGGLGPCGRILCCTSFLTEFAPVSIRMAKSQNLSLNPTKISGACGRLLCCLRYEVGMYNQEATREAIAKKQDEWEEELAASVAPGVEGSPPVSRERPRPKR